MAWLSSVVLPNQNMGLFAVGGNDYLYKFQLNQKTSNDPSAWTAWYAVLPRAPIASPPVVRIASGNLAGNTIQLWLIDSSGSLWSCWTLNPQIDPTSGNAYAWSQWTGPGAPRNADMLVQNVAVGQLTNSALQVFVMTTAGIFTTWNANPADPKSYVEWQPFPAPMPSGLGPLTVAGWSDSPPQVFVPNYTNSQIFTSWKVSMEPWAQWTEWREFQTPNYSVVQIASTQLSDGRTQLFALVNPVGMATPSSNVYTCWKETTQPGASWTPWTEFHSINGSDDSPIIFSHNTCICGGNTGFPGPQGNSCVVVYVDYGNVVFSQKESMDLHAGWTQWAFPTGPALPF